MTSILDTLTISDADLRMTKRASCAEVDEKSSFCWHFVYSVYLDADDSDFERRVCSLFAPYGDVIIKDVAGTGVDVIACRNMEKI